MGGFYLLTAPSPTRPLARAFDGETRGEIFDALTDRMNEWLTNAGERVFSRVPEAEEYLKVDRVNHKNRIYKTLLSVHSSIPGVVRPIDTREVCALFSDLHTAFVERFGEHFERPDFPGMPGPMGTPTAHDSPVVRETAEALRDRWLDPPTLAEPLFEEQSRPPSRESEANPYR